MKQFQSPRSSLAALGVTAAALLAIPLTTVAAPGDRSVADIAACADGESSAFVCSSKGLSNVILQCSDGETTHFEKFDDLDETGEIYEGSYACASGSLDVVYVKSGSGKTAEGPAGAGELFSGLAACPAECPEVPLEAEIEEEAEEEELEEAEEIEGADTE